MKGIIRKIVGKIVVIIIPIIADIVLDVLEEMAKATPTKIDDTVLAEIRKKYGIPD